MAANTGPCDLFASNTWAYVNVPLAGHVKAWGMRSTMYQSTRLAICSPVLFNNQDGPSFWVSLVKPGIFNDIVQVGEVKCDHENPPSAICDGTVHYFWAWGQSTGGACTTNDSPIARDLGVAAAGGHAFQMDRTTSVIHYKIDGVITVTQSVSVLDCWLNSPGVVAQFACERWDDGDQCGSSANNIQANVVRWQFANGGAFVDPGLHVNDAECAVTHVDLHCDIQATDDVNFWTTN